MKRSPPRPTQEGAPVATSPAQKILLVTFGVALFLLGLGLLEGLLALLGAGDRHLYEDPFVGFDPRRELFGEKRLADGRTVYATHPGKLSFFDYQEFSARKPEGALRVFALGGSTTAGRPYDSRVAFPRWMELYLQAMDPGRPIEVINAGAISYASYRIVVLMKELVRYEPDVFVIYTGHNEFLEERTYAGIIHQSPARKKLRLWLGGLRLYTLARQGLARLRPPPPAETLAGEVATRLDNWGGLDLYHRDEELKRSIIEHFEYNLHQMAAIARARGARVVFVKPVSNLKDFSPFKSEHSASLSEREAARFAALLEEGRALLAAGRAGEASPAFEEALAADPRHAEAHFRLGRCRLELGDAAGAKAAFVRAKDLDVAPLRALTEIEDLVVAVAEERGLGLVDLPAILEADSRRRYGHPMILGNEYLLDHVHPDYPVHGLIAERVIDVLLAEGVARRAPGWSEAKRRRVAERLEASIDREYHARRDHNLAKVLLWAGKMEEAEAPLLRAAEVLADHPEVWLNQGILYEKTGRFEQAVAALRRAVALDPGSAEARFNLGTNLGFLGRRREGIAELEEAIRLRPDDALTHLNLGVLYRDEGELERAFAAFERAAALAPGASSVPRNQGLAYGRQGRPEKAIAAFRRALELDPEDAAARADLGIAYARQGRPEDARSELERALELDPGNVAARFNLAVLHSSAGRPEVAAAAYERVIELAPGHAEARNNLGILHARAGRLDEAARQLARAVEIDPAYAEAHFNLGLVLHDSGNLREAARAIERALELTPGDARMHATLAGLYRALGDPERARLHSERAGRSGG